MIKHVTRASRWVIAAALVLSVGLASVAAADFESSDAANQQEGDNEASSDQDGSAGSGDAVGGQVAGIVSSGDASVDARNRSEDVDIETGSATAANEADAFAGLDFQATSTFQGPIADESFVNASDITASDAFNQQEGDNTLDLTQTADASSGDGVGGQVIGVVTSAGGSADVVADNASEDIDADTGDATATNVLDGFVGLNYETESAEVFFGFPDVGFTSISFADIASSTAANQQEGDNDLSSEQAADAETGDGVGGQVLGVVSAGDASIDARSRSDDIDIDTGEATAANGATAFAGLDYFASETDTSFGPPIVDTTFVNASDIAASDAVNQQEGDNTLDLTQTADASSGDGVGGQVIGVVTSAGGSADVVADNASEDIDADTGDATATNDLDGFVGLRAAITDVFNIVINLDITSSTALNQQDGDNDLSAEQTADADTGDGVGGQVLGVVSAGDASIDARNRSEDVDIDTGNAAAANAATAFVGLDLTSTELTNVIIGLDFTSSSAINQQDGNNSSSVLQTADTSSGDGVGGQVAGVVVAAGGTVDTVLDNASEDIDVSTGDARHENRLVQIAGHVAEFFSGCEVEGP